MTEKITPLYEEHVALGANLTEFGGWQMPLRYSSDLAEHRAVRESAGLFDLSHMGDIVVRGPQAAIFLDHALIGALSRVRPLRARYTMLCAADGGVLDDLIVYRVDENAYFVVANAANTDVVLGELNERAADFDVEVRLRPTALLAVQGPRAEEILRATDGLAADPDAAGAADATGTDATAMDATATNATGADATATDAVATLTALRYYAWVPMRFRGVEIVVGRTGYTGEDGFEIWIAPEHAVDLWRTLLAAGEPYGLVPAGLAARDSLRLEAGMPLYGHELDTTTTPFEAGMGRVVKFDKETDSGDPVPFTGREALASRQGAQPARVLVGLRGAGRRPARAEYDVVRRTLDGGVGAKVGYVTSGAPSPTLGYPIAMAYVTPEVSQADTELAVDVRGRAEPFVVVPLPFYRRTQQ